MMRVTKKSVMEKVMTAVIAVACVTYAIVIGYWFSVKNRMKEWNETNKLIIYSGNSSMSCSNVDNVTDERIHDYLEWVNSHSGYERKTEDDIYYVKCYTEELHPICGKSDKLIEVKMLEDGIVEITDYSVPKWVKKIVGGPLKFTVPNYAL